MPKALKYSQTWFDCDAGGNSYAKYQAGQTYPLHDDAERHIAAGIAEEIDVRAGTKDAADKVEKTQGKATAATAAAVSAAAEAVATTEEK